MSARNSFDAGVFARLAGVGCLLSFGGVCALAAHRGANWDAAVFFFILGGIGGFMASSGVAMMALRFVVDRRRFACYLCVPLSPIVLVVMGKFSPDALAIGFRKVQNRAGRNGLMAKNWLWDVSYDLVADKPFYPSEKEWTALGATWMVCAVIPVAAWFLIQHLKALA